MLSVVTDLRFFSVKAPRGNTFRVPVMSCVVAAGFPSPADDHLDNSLDLSELLIKRPSATFFVRVTGESMRGVGILPGDILIVDRSENAVDGSIVIAVVNGECLVKILCFGSKGTWLQSANKAFPMISIDEDTDFQIWGVVSGVVRQHGAHGRVCSG
jgi:DNA polymerase V